MGKGLDTGKAFFQGVLAKITDPEAKAAAEKLLSNETVLTEIGNGVEGQSEIDRQLQTLRTQKEELDTLQGQLEERKAGLESWYTDLSTWHQQNKDALEEAKQLKANGGKPNGKPADEKPTAGLNPEALDERLVGERAAFLGFQRDQNLITREHFAKFNEIPDLEPLLKHPQIAHLGLLGVYELVHKDRLKAHADDQQKKHDDAIAQNAVKEFAAKQAQMPYPSPTGSGSGSPLDALTTGAKDSVVDAATSHYNRLQAERAGAAS